MENLWKSTKRSLDFNCMVKGGKNGYFSNCITTSKYNLKLLSSLPLSIPQSSLWHHWLQLPERLRWQVGIPGIALDWFSSCLPNMRKWCPPWLSPGSHSVCFTYASSPVNNQLPHITVLPITGNWTSRSTQTSWIIACYWIICLLQDYYFRTGWQRISRSSTLIALKLR